MNRRAFVGIVFLHILLMSGLCKAADPPNVVFIYIDDLGYSDVGFLGAQHYRTPAIDALANQGMIFTNAYASAPNCAPSRACLLSGQYTPRHGIYTVGNPDRGKSRLRKLIPVKNNTVLRKGVTTLGEMFQDAGYTTGYFGKWHLGIPGSTGPMEQGFDTNIGGNHSGTPLGGHFSPYNNPQLPDPGTREYLTDRLTDEAIQFIRTHHKKPFLVLLSHYAVHTPIQAKPELTRTYETSARDHKYNAKYAAMIQSVDQSVAAIMKEISDLSLDRNTLVVFYSDNGGHGKITRCDPLRGGKGMAYEGGIRVPLAIRWAGQIEKGTTCNVPVIGVDFYETFRVMLNAAAPIDQPLDGVDIMPLLKGEVTTLDRPLYWHFPAYLQGENYSGAPDPHFRARPFGIIRDGDWKLIESFEDHQLELYNLSSDIAETNNLAGQKPELAHRLLGQLQKWRAGIDAPVPTEANPQYRPQN